MTWLEKLKSELPDVLEFRSGLESDDLLFFDTRIETRDVGDGSDRIQWVFAMPVGPTVYVDATGERHEMDLDEDLLSVVASEFRRATFNFKEAAPSGKTAFTFPALKVHKDDGERFGDLLDAKISGQGDTRGLYVKVQWSESTWEKILADEFKFVSVGIKRSYEDELGNEYGPILNELSLTANPRIKRIGSIQDTLTFSDGDQMTKEELEQMLAKVKEEAKAEALEEFRAESQAAQPAEPQAPEPQPAEPQPAPQLQTPALAASETGDNGASTGAPISLNGGNAPSGWDSDNVADRVIARLQHRAANGDAKAAAGLRFAEVASASQHGGPTPPPPKGKLHVDLALAEAVTEKELTGVEAVIYAQLNYDR